MSGLLFAPTPLAEKRDVFRRTARAVPRRRLLSHSPAAPFRRLGSTFLSSLGAGHALQMGSYFEPATQARIFGPTGQFVRAAQLSGSGAKPACVAVPQLVVGQCLDSRGLVRHWAAGPDRAGDRPPVCSQSDSLPQFGCIHVDTTNSRLASRVTKDAGHLIGRKIDDQRYR